MKRALCWLLTRHRPNVRYAVAAPKPFRVVKAETGPYLVTGKVPCYCGEHWILEGEPTR